MRDLKPKFIIADNRSKSRYFKYLFPMFIFAAGFYTGYLTKENSLFQSYKYIPLENYSITKSINNNIDNLGKYLDIDDSRTELKPSSVKIAKPYMAHKKAGSIYDTNHSQHRDSINSINYSDQKYTLQIAAFETENKTQEVVSDLIKKGHNAYSTIGVNSRGDKWHLVRIGIFDSYNEAYTQSEAIYKSHGIVSDIEILEPQAITKLSNFEIE